ncbi:MAG: triose-phosphate isomerase, partial [Deltaproteobacteria bacterium]|nr:triose-phosphate isomerase [Deltaproteobacteria bacterium]
ASWEPKGAFTGEIAPDMLKEVGCAYVIIGHSERRQLFGETDATVNQRIKAVYKAGLLPIFCVGETLAEREANQTLSVVERQVNGGLAGLSAEDAKTLVIAYEPVWAIGTGKVATTAQAQEVHASIRRLLASAYGAAIASAIRIQYGGSVKPDNAADLLAQPDIDGALVGGASLKADDFAKIIKAALHS